MAGSIFILVLGLASVGGAAVFAHQVIRNLMKYARKKALIVSAENAVAVTKRIQHTVNGVYQNTEHVFHRDVAVCVEFRAPGGEKIVASLKQPVDARVTARDPSRLPQVYTFAKLAPGRTLSILSDKSNPADIVADETALLITISLLMLAGGALGVALGIWGIPTG